MTKAPRARKLSSNAAAEAQRGVSDSILAVLAQAGGDLGEARRIAQELIDILPVPVFIKARDGRYLAVNRAWEEFFGIARETFVGQQVVDLYPGAPWVAAEHQAMDDQLWKAHGSQSYEIKIATRGGPRSTIYHKVTFPGADGEVAGLMGTIIDVTGRKRAKRALRESEERFRQTFELAGSGIAHVDLQGRFQRVNRSLARILGYAAEELVGRTVKEVSHPDDRNLTDTGRGDLRAGASESAHFEKRYLRKDGATVWVDLTVALVRDGEGRPLYEIAVFEEITERKLAEQALREAHDELARSNAELEQFAYVASHDLQEPLRMVASYTQLLGKRYGERLDGDAQEFMAFIVDGAARMKQLIEDLLAYSRLGTRGRNLAPVSLEAMLKRALANLRAALEETGAAVTSDLLPEVTADESQLVQLLQNLIGNALKFRGQASPRIHVGCSSNENDWEIAVRDNGIGIEPQYFERIFMVFQRLHDKGEYPGTGIGLAICKKVVDRHGGRIWVESQPGGGTSFHFTLPKKRGNPHG
ncbi:MAG: sensor histidine kinase [Burkholderiales bacterium]